MTDTTNTGGEERPGFIKRWWNSGQAIPQVIAFVITVVSLPFVIPLLPVEEHMGVLGVVFIYFLVFIMLGLIARILMGIVLKVASLGRKS